MCATALQYDLSRDGLRDMNEQTTLTSKVLDEAASQPMYTTSVMLGMSSRLWSWSADRSHSACDE